MSENKLVYIASPYAGDSDNASYVTYEDGGSNYDSKSDGRYVRLVCGRQ